MSFVRTLARPMLASSFVLAGLDKLRNADDTAQQLNQQFLVVITKFCQ